MTSPPPPTVRARTPGAPTSLRLFDGLAPFFLGHPEGTINWSRIPFAHLERDGVLDTTRVADILIEFDRHVAAMARLGYNALVIDDLAHLVAHPFYPEALKRKLASYRDLYRHVFATAAAHGLMSFVTTDALVANQAVEHHLRSSGNSAADVLRATVEAAFDAWPSLDGVVLRVGECDGVDVQGDFISRLAIRTAGETRSLLQTLMRVFEARGKTLIFRTWTLGAYPIGDLIWNRQTYDEVFEGIDSDNLVVSLKYGDADFFRFLELNPLFFHGPQQKIVELQCRREYEGMGEYPAFVGHLYAGYLNELRSGGSNLIGIYALQGGGWAPFRKTAFCTNASTWNELNAEVTVRLFNEDETLEHIVGEFCTRHGISDPDALIQLMTLADAAIENGLYIREVATTPLYFRRVRIPPLTWVFWNNVTTDGVVAALIRHMVTDPAAAIDEGYRAAETVEDMLCLARRLGLPDDGLDFQLDTFRILACAREVMLADARAPRSRLRELLADYDRNYPHTYRFDTSSVAGTSGPRQLPGLIFALLLRHHAAYRRRDRLMLSRGVSRLQRFVVDRQAATLPDYVNTVGMATDVLLR